jgi:phosphatidate phosphatase LPIN
MSALAQWRDTVVRNRANGIPSRPSSPPLSDEEGSEKVEEPDELQDHKRSKSEPPEPGISVRKPTPSPWVRWWGRSRSSKEAEVNGQGGRPVLKASSSVLEGVSVKKTKSSDTILLDSGASQTAPALPSTPDTRAVEPPSRKADLLASVTEKKFAKTLRLTSDQLVSFTFFQANGRVNRFHCTEKSQFETWKEHHYIFSFHVRCHCVYGTHLRVGLNRSGRRF